MSVLTATKSTCVMPASIIRSSAFSPAPPTPTTRITARYDDPSRVRSRRAGLSGIGSSQRVIGGSGSRTSTASTASTARAGSGARCGSSPRRAASVFRNSSASGPSRMLARLRATEHLLRQVTVELGGLAAGLVRQHRRPPHRRLRVADGLADARLVDEVAEVLAQDLVRLARVRHALVVHRRQDA